MSRPARMPRSIRLTQLADTDRRMRRLPGDQLTELPPPTTTTWESVHASASLGPAP